MHPRGKENNVKYASVPRHFMSFSDQLEFGCSLSLVALNLLV